MNRVSGHAVQPREEQGGQGVRLGRLPLVGVAHAGAPPEAAAERVVPEPALLEVLGLQDRRVQVIVPREAALC
jgi:hypothetical protein